MTIYRCDVCRRLEEREADVRAFLMSWGALTDQKFDICLRCARDLDDILKKFFANALDGPRGLPK